MPDLGGKHRTFVVEKVQAHSLWDQFSWFGWITIINNRHMENTTPANQLVTCGGFSLWVSKPAGSSTPIAAVCLLACSISRPRQSNQKSVAKTATMWMPGSKKGATTSICSNSLNENQQKVLCEPCSFAGFSMPRRLSAWCPAPQQKVQGISKTAAGATCGPTAQPAHTQLGSETARRPRQKRWIRISVGSKGSGIHRLASI